MKISFPVINKNIPFGIQNDMPIKPDNNNYKKFQKEISSKDISSLKPVPLLRNEIVAERLKMLTPIKTKGEYNELLKEVLEYRKPPSPNGLREPVIQRWDYENSDNDLKGLIAYCGGDDLSEIINCWLTGRTFNNRIKLNDEQIANIIRCMEFSLKKLDDTYGTYKGIVYRKGFFNPKTDKQFYSATTQSIKAVKHSKENLPSEKNPYSIIIVKSGHDIEAFQLNANSFLSRKFAQTEKEVLIDRNARFRLVPEDEYIDDEKKLKEILLTQAVKNTDEITEKDIQQTVKENKDLLKYISLWEEI